MRTLPGSGGGQNLRKAADGVVTSARFAVALPMATTDPEPRLAMTVSQAAEELGVSIATVRRWSNAGHLDAYRTPGGQRRFTQEQLDAFLESLKPKAQPPGGTSG